MSPSIASIADSWQLGGIFSNFFVPGAWLFGAFFVIIPFCCMGSENCYTAAPQQQQQQQLPPAQVLGCQVVTATIVTSSNPLHPTMPPQGIFQPATATATATAIPPQQGQVLMAATATALPAAAPIQPQIATATAVPVVVMPTAPPSAAVRYRPAMAQAVTDHV